MLKAPLYNQKGEEIGTTNLPEKIFGVKYLPDLISQAFRAYRSKLRKPLAHTKGRGEVRGGGRKPWRQKGTGRARHGSRRSPIWKGGGVTFGPRKERKFELELPKKMRIKALCSVLSRKLHDQEVKVIDDITLEKAKTKDMEAILKNFLPESKKYKYQRTLVALPKTSTSIMRATRNLPYARSLEARNLNVHDLLNYRYLILPKESIRVLEATFGASKSRKSKIAES